MAYLPDNWKVNMADKVTYTSHAAKVAAEANTSAFQFMTQITPLPNGFNTYSDPSDLNTKMYMNYRDSTGTAKDLAFQQLYASMIRQPAPTGKGNMFDYVQTLLRASGLSKDKTALGIPGSGDRSALDTAISGTIGTGAPDLISYLQGFYANGGTGAGGNKPKVQDTTTQYNKQISTALQLKDYNDAKQAVSDAYAAAWGQPISEDLIKKFQVSWNEEAVKQVATSTQDYVTKQAPVYDTKSKPVIDPKTGKQKVDAFGHKVYSKKELNKITGVPVYESTTKQKSTTTGEGFTTEEQGQFLATYLATNFPDANLDPTKIGGVAKATYDDLVATAKANFADVPTLDSLAPIIKSIIGTTDKTISDNILNKYKEDLRQKAAIKYNGITDYLTAGKNASDYVNPLLDVVRTTLQKDVTLDDPLMKKLLNFKGADGKYRLMNDYELTQALMSDTRYATTSTAINEAINMSQSLRSQLGK